MALCNRRSLGSFHLNLREFGGRAQRPISERSSFAPRARQKSACRPSSRFVIRGVALILRRARDPISGVLLARSAEHCHENSAVPQWTDDALRLGGHRRGHIDRANAGPRRDAVAVGAGWTARHGRRFRAARESAAPEEVVRRALLVVAVLAAALSIGSDPSSAQCGPNPIVCENSLPGNLASEWDITGSGDPTIQGFTTDISVGLGQIVHFKIDTNATAYRLHIYRTGHFRGPRGRGNCPPRPPAGPPRAR